MGKQRAARQKQPAEGTRRQRRQQLQQELAAQTEVKDRFFRPQRITAMNEAQGHYLISMESKTLTFGVGPAGTGKTYLCTTLGAQMLHIKLFSPDLSDAERGFLETLSPAFTELESTAEDTLFVGGAERLLSEDRLQELSQIGDLMTVLERRVALLGMLRSALEEPSVYLRIGEENETPELRSVSVVAANYGVPARNLGAVSVLGPVRMDYPTAIASVREAAAELSRFVSDLYDE